jgi:hypothetical protein
MLPRILPRSGRRLERQSSRNMTWEPSSSSDSPLALESSDNEVKGTGFSCNEGPRSAKVRAHDLTPTLDPVRSTQLVTPLHQTWIQDPITILRLMTLSRAARNNSARLNLRMGQRKSPHEMPTGIVATSLSPLPSGATWYS